MHPAAPPRPPQTRRVKTLRVLAVLLSAFAVTACDVSAAPITTAASGEVVIGITADARGAFDGEVNELSDLEDLARMAWGDGWLGSHRGHRPIENVLEAYWGINHRQMHILMEDENMNMADVCRHFGFPPENLVDTLAASFAPFVAEGVKNGVITELQAAEWNKKIRAAFHKRVHWRE